MYTIAANILLVNRMMRAKKMWWKRIRCTMKSIHLSWLNHWLHYTYSMYNSFTCWYSFGILLPYGDFMGQRRNHWKICLCLLVDWGKLDHFQRPNSQPQRIPNLKCEAQFKNNVQKISHFDLGPIASNHSFIQTSTDSLRHSLNFIWLPTSSTTLSYTLTHSCSFIHPPIIYSWIHPHYYQSFLFCGAVDQPTWIK